MDIRSPDVKACSVLYEVDLEGVICDKGVQVVSQVNMARLNQQAIKSSYWISFDIQEEERIEKQKKVWLFFLFVFLFERVVVIFV